MKNVGKTFWEILEIWKFKNWKKFMKILKKEMGKIHKIKNRKICEIEKYCENFEKTIFSKIFPAAACTVYNVENYIPNMLLIYLTRALTCS